MQNVKPEDFDLFLNAIIHSSKEGIFVADHNGDVVLVNQASATMNGLSISEIVGKNVSDLLAEGYSQRSATLEVLKTKKTISLINITKGNKKILTTGTPIFNDSGDIKFVFVNERDITFINKLTRMLDKDKSTGNRAKIDFLDSSLAKKELNNYVFESLDMQIVVQTAMQVAEFDLDVIITGESGVGKGIIAKLIHRLSDRRKGPFVDVNCGSISENLIEAELFGYEKGAFTGACATGKMGHFEFANNGTLFLDEVGELSLPLQVKLLKFLENKEIVRVGGVKPLKIDTQIITATNKNLEGMVSSGTFRKDLFFRLNVVPIHIPPLRERKSDIEPLILFFLDRFNHDYKLNKVISGEVVAVLVEYAYPGNVRELENLVRRLVTMTKGDRIRLGNLPDSTLFSIDRDVEPDKSSKKTLKNSVQNYEKELIMKAVNKYGSQRRAAIKLGLDQSTLSRKLSKLSSAQLLHE
jgi:PAS domain S-box-containing protein